MIWPRDGQLKAMTEVSAAATSGGGQPFAIEGRARDRVLEAVGETVKEDQKIAPPVGQIVHGALAEAALPDVLNGGYRANGIGREIAVVDEGRAVCRILERGGRNHLGGIACQRFWRAVYDTVGREVDCCRHILISLERAVRTTMPKTIWTRSSD